jgi:hypothetical protein
MEVSLRAVRDLPGLEQKGWFKMTAGEPANVGGRSWPKTAQRSNPKHKKTPPPCGSGVLFNRDT